MNAPTNTETGEPLSVCSLSLLSGAPVALWADPRTAVGTAVRSDTVAVPLPELSLGLAPGALAVVGRAAPHHRVPYLDPAYRATRLVPGSGQSVLMNGEHDLSVSRGHFTLRGAGGGAVVFTNGVPAAGGGVRPPTNGTWLVSPQRRPLDPCEEVHIEPGEAVVVCLPNGCTLQLAAG
ncbi:hypothetical protein GobsT_08250 [Gemmata obscuriglobus]|uniref:Uncharacterized protein n=1 Tax=Gemmata obscuriglobus TaxID=114 RepID=A0A2Z3H4F6_9BACT|nr:hypothetical protein [Gemmata obscuriglobus]AWM40648.1 hypothetical protein C1280_29135 [Gemmata obscuriglobus]QEG26090.1 hypothetical protein GobsT_08250 [Gemmata obscuriglobus]VTS00553.1 unnamed protein product [Gemmata obscuriglobus UQM 2246]